jgi:hypothetical protein
MNADKPFVPASTMKLFTTAIALEKLGSEHTFSTDVLRDGTMDKDGVVHGNLIIRGDGDPALSQRFVKGGAKRAYGHAGDAYQERWRHQGDWRSHCGCIGVRIAHHP